MERYPATGRDDVPTHGERRRAFRMSPRVLGSGFTSARYLLLFALAPTLDRPRASSRARSRLPTSIPPRIVLSWSDSPSPAPSRDLFRQSLRGPMYVCAASRVFRSRCRKLLVPPARSPHAATHVRPATARHPVGSNARTTSFVYRTVAVVCTFVTWLRTRSPQLPVHVRSRLPRVRRLYAPLPPSFTRRFSRRRLSYPLD